VSPARDLDRQKVDAFLSAFSALRAESWADKGTSTGLETPQIALAVSFEEGKKQERVSFAKTGENVYASRSDEPGAAKIPTTEYDSAVRALEDVLK
jgi:hypothetical protein